jgi:hypothetical protein
MMMLSMWHFIQYTNMFDQIPSSFSSKKPWSGKGVLSSSCRVRRTISHQRFELHLSLLALSQEKFDFVSKWVNDVFPCDLDDYSATSICARLISSVSVSLLFLHYPNDDERPPESESSHRYVTLSNTVLQALAGVTQNSVSEIEDVSSKVSQKARKYAKRTRQANQSIDTTPFRALHLDVPALRYEAKEMALEILMKQKGILLVTMFAPSFLYCNPPFLIGVSQRASS